jgi:DNA-binding GntR family transcriptional regulator
LALAEQYGVSRITVRRALAELAGEGYLASRQGRGTFVSFKRVQPHMRTFGGFNESLGDGVKNKSSRILSKDIEPADAEVSGKLGIAEGTRVLHLRRVMAEGETPYMLDNAWFIEAMYPRLSEILADDLSTFAIMQERYGIVFARAHKILGVVRAGLEHAQLLGCVPGDPLFSIRKVIYDPQDVAVHYSHYYLLGDRFMYCLDVAGDQPDMELLHREPGDPLAGSQS